MKCLLSNSTDVVATLCSGSEEPMERGEKIRHYEKNSYLNRMEYLEKLKTIDKTVGVSSFSIYGKIYLL